MIALSPAIALPVPPDDGEAPAEPITVEQLVKFGRIDRPDEADLYGPMISAARQQIELDTGVSLVAQGWELYYDATPVDGQGLALTKGPVQQVLSVSYMIGNNPSTVIDDGTWMVAAGSTGVPEVRMVPGASWPPAAAGQRFLVQLVAGVEFVPPLLVQALYILASHFARDGRDLVVPVALTDVPHTYVDCIQPFVRIALI